MSVGRSPRYTARDLLDTTGRGGTAFHAMSRWCHAFLVHGLDEPRQEGKIMNKPTEQQGSPVFGLRYLEDREVEGLDVVGCRIFDGSHTATGCDDTDQIA